MKNKPKKINNKAVIYQAANGAIALRGDALKETIWATQAQIAKIFSIERSVITRHIGNIFKSEEVDQKSNVQKLHIANSDKPVLYYSLDIILSVGYRVNSGRAIVFRKWANKILREHITQGYSIDKKRIIQNYDSFIKAVDSVRELLPLDSKVDSSTILELIKTFANTWFSLDSYDKDNFLQGKATKKNIAITASDLNSAIAELKKELIKKGEASPLFAVEKNRGAIEGIIGNVMQSFAGQDLYLSLEEKAAHLLYFIIKNHPFTDGNKRSGAFAFIWFLRRAKILNLAKLTPEALTVITILIAESNPKDKEKMTGLVAMLLRKK